MKVEFEDNFFTVYLIFFNDSKFNVKFLKTYSKGSKLMTINDDLVCTDAKICSKTS